MDEHSTSTDLERRLAVAEAALRAKADVEADLRQSEELRRIAVEGGRMGTWRWNLRDELIWGDAAFLSLWGYPPSDEPRPLSDFTDRMSPQGRAEMGEMVPRAIASGEEFDGQLAVVTGPTHGHWVRWRGRAEREQPWIVNGVSFDVTDQRAQDQRLRESEARHRLLIEHWTQAVWETDPYGRVVADSPSWRAYTGQTLEQWLGYGWLDAIHPDDPAYAEWQWREAVTARGLVDAEFRLRDPTGGWRWTNVRATPVLDAGGNIEKWAGMNIDIDARKTAEAALRESEVRFRALATAGAQTIYRMSPDWQVMHQLEGGTLAPTTDPIEQWVDKYILPEDRSEVNAVIAEAIRTKSMFELEHRVQAADGDVTWVLSRAVPILGKDGEILEWFGAAADVSARKEAEAALRESEKRLRGFGDASQDVLWIREAETLRWTYLTPAFETIYGLGREEALTGDDFRNWTDLILPEDRDKAVANLQRVREGEGVTWEYRIRRPRDGEIRWMRDTDFPMRDAAGAVRWIGGVGRDITEEKATAEHMSVLVAELQHRTRNLMGIVRATADKTLRHSADLPDFKARYDARLAALSRVQGLLSRLGEGERVTFDELVRSEVAAHDGGTGKVTLHGPSGVALRSSTLQTFALALHELATNALKYGALAQAQARLEIHWRLEHTEPEREPLLHEPLLHEPWPHEPWPHEPWLHVDWREHGVSLPADGGAVRSGSGRELIERALPYQLGARTTYVMEADGVHCIIALPVSGRTITGRKGDA